MMSPTTASSAIIRTGARRILKKCKVRAPTTDQTAAYKFFLRHDVNRGMRNFLANLYLPWAGTGRECPPPKTRLSWNACCDSHIFATSLPCRPSRPSWCSAPCRGVKLRSAGLLTLHRAPICACCTLESLGGIYSFGRQIKKMVEEVVQHIDISEVLALALRTGTLCQCS